MNTSLRSLLFGLALGIGSTSVALAASISPVRLGDLLDPSISHTATVQLHSGAGVFDGRGYLQLGSPGDGGIGGASVNFNVTPTLDFNIGNFMSGGLYAMDDAIVNGATGQSLSFSNLAQGSYYFLIKRNVTGTVGGFFALTAPDSSAPLPASVLVLGAGLVGLVAIARRRKVAADAMPAAAQASDRAQSGSAPRRPSPRMPICRLQTVSNQVFGQPHPRPSLGKLLTRAPSSA